MVNSSFITDSTPVQHQPDVATGLFPPEVVPPPDKIKTDETKTFFCSLPLEKVQSILTNYTTLSLTKNESKSPIESTKTKQLRKILCLYCDRSFVSEALRQKHVERCHSPKQLRRVSLRKNQNGQLSTACVYCDRIPPTSLDQLFLHLLAHHSNKYFACETCKERFLNRTQLNEHNLQIHHQTNDKVSKRRTSPKTAQKDESKIVKRSKRLQAKNTEVETVLAPKKPKKLNRKTEIGQNVELNPYPEFDSYYQVKKITDHSIDNLKISSLTFDDVVFDKAFFNRIQNNIQENLQNHIDGKLNNDFASESRISNFEQKIEQEIDESPHFEHYDLSLNAITPSASLISHNFGEEIDAQVEFGTKPARKKPVRDEVHYKYFTRRKYQAILMEQKQNRDLSKLDMWTQYVVKNRQQKIIEAKKTPKEISDWVLSDEHRKTVQREELNKIIDRRGPFEDLREEVVKNATNLKSIDIQGEVCELLNDLLDDLCEREEIVKSRFLQLEPRSGDEKQVEFAEIPDYLNLRRTSSTEKDEIDRSDKIALICSSQETEYLELPTNTVRGKNEKVELTGEWARSRIYICAACGVKLQNMKQLLEHKSSVHQYVWTQHYEFVGNQSELYQELCIPTLGRIGVLENSEKCKMFKRSEARRCTKCGKQCNSLGELHRHILECGGDWTWMLARKKCKYRPFGAKSRRKRRGLVKRMLNTQKSDGPMEKRKYNKKLKIDGPRPKPSDAETIQRMLANLPAKRATRKICSLKDGFNNQKRNTIGSKENKTTKQYKCGKLTNERIKVDKNLTTPQQQQQKTRNRRRSLRSLNKVLASRILDTNSSLIARRRLRDKQKKSEKVIDEKVVKRSSPRFDKKVKGDTIRKTVENAVEKMNIKRFFTVKKSIKRKTVEEVKEKEKEVVKRPKREVVINRQKLKTKNKVEKQTKVDLKSKNGPAADSKVEKLVEEEKPKKRGNSFKSAVLKEIKKLKTSRNKKIVEERPKAEEEIKTLLNEQNKDEVLVENKVKNVKNEENVGFLESAKDDKTEIFIETQTNHNSEPLLSPASNQRRKLRKPGKGLNDCIAMLTSKLNTKQIKPVVEQVVEEKLEELVTKPNSEEMKIIQKEEEKLKLKMAEYHSKMLVAPSTQNLINDDFILKVPLFNEHFCLKQTESIVCHDFIKSDHLRKEMEEEKTKVKIADKNEALKMTETLKVNFWKCLLANNKNGTKVEKRTKKTKSNKKKTNKQLNLNEFLLSNDKTIDNLPVDKEETCNEAIIVKQVETAENNVFNSKTVQSCVEIEDINEPIKEAIAGPLLTEEKTCKLIPEKQTVNLLLEKEAVNLVPEKEAVNLLLEKEAVNLVPEKEAVNLAPEKEAVNLVPEKEAVNLVHEKEAVNLVPEKAAVNLVPEKAVVNLIPELDTVNLAQTEVKHTESEVISAMIESDDEIPLSAFMQNDQSWLHQSEKRIFPLEVSSKSNSPSKTDLPTGGNIDEFIPSPKSADLCTSLAKFPTLEAGNEKNDIFETKSLSMATKLDIFDFNELDEDDEPEIKTISTKIEIKENVNGKTLRKLSRCNKNKVIDVIYEEALSELTNNERNRDNSECKSVKRARKSNRKKSESVLPSNEKADEKLVDEEVLSTKELRRSGRKSRKIIYNEIDMVDPLIDDLDSKMEKEIKNIQNEGLVQQEIDAKKAKMELIENLEVEKFNSDQLFDLLKANEENKVVEEQEVVPNCSNDLIEAKIEENPIKIIDEVVKVIAKCKKTKKKAKAKVLEVKVDLNVAKVEDNGLKLNYCEICNKSFCRLEGLIKHKRTLTHISKLSELEAKEAENRNKTEIKTQPLDLDEKTLDLNEKALDLNEKSLLLDDSSQKSFDPVDKLDTEPISPQFTVNLKLADIINDVLNKPVAKQATEAEAEDLEPLSPEIKRCRSLGERKSFDFEEQDKQEPEMQFFVPQQEIITNTAQKQISLLENIIENRYSREDEAPEKMVEIIEAKSDFMQPKSNQFEEISEDGQKARKVLNRDEELFLECCSLLKSSSEVSNFTKKSKSFNLETLKLMQTDNNWFDGNYKNDIGCEVALIDESNESNWNNNSRHDSDMSFESFDDFANVKERMVSTFDDVISKNQFKRDTFECTQVETKKSDDLSDASTTDSRKLITKGALKVFEGIKVSIPTEELNLTNLLKTKSPTLPKTHDIYDFEETIDNSDVFPKPTICKPESDDDENNEVLSTSSESNPKAKSVENIITKKKCMIMGRIFKNAAKSKLDEHIRNIPIVDNTKLVADFVRSCPAAAEERPAAKMTEEEMNLAFDRLLGAGKKRAPTPVRKRSVNGRTRAKKRPADDSDRSDDEFELKKSTKRRTKRRGRADDNCINLEQEIKECIGVAGRKSQRKCTSGKQNVLIEYWSSDDSNFEALLLVAEEKKVVVETKVVKPSKASRNKRQAPNPLYHWSSSSEDESGDLIEVKPVREVEDDEDRPIQHGWIVGDSPKKLVTMLAQAKGKKCEEGVKEQGRKRTNS